MHPIAKSRFASGWISSIRNCATYASVQLPTGPGPGTLRSAARARRLRRRLRRPHQGPEESQHRQAGAAVARQSAPPRGVRLRGEHRRRRRHPDADAGSVPSAEKPAVSGSRCRPSAATAPAWCSCRATRRSASGSRRCSKRSSSTRASSSSAGATCQPMTTRLVRARSPSSPCSSRSSSVAPRVRRRPAPQSRATPSSSASSTSSGSESSTRSTRPTCRSTRSASSTSSASRRTR